jgi:hypothetical protein
MKFKEFVLVEAPNPAGSPPSSGGQPPMGMGGGMPPGGLSGMPPMGGAMGPMSMGGGAPPPMGLGGPTAPPMGMPGAGQPQTNLEIKTSNVWDALDKFLSDSGGQEDKHKVKSSQLSPLSKTGSPPPTGNKHLL